MTGASWAPTPRAAVMGRRTGCGSMPPTPTTMRRRSSARGASPRHGDGAAPARRRGRPRAVAAQGRPRRPDRGAPHPVDQHAAGAPRGLPAQRTLAARPLRRAGHETQIVHVMEGGLPVVVADWQGRPGKPHLTMYGHYAVQPVDPTAEWKPPPFPPPPHASQLY